MHVEFFFFFGKEMSLSKKGIQTNTKLSIPDKSTALNPNAAEFVPFSLRSSPSPSGSVSNTAATNARFAASGAIGKAVVDRSESSISNTSDEEAHQFWRHQLPDDITPDFKVMSEDESHAFEGLSLAGLSMHESTEMPKFAASLGGGYMLTEQQEPPPRHINGNNFSEKMRYAAAAYGDDPTSASYMNLPTKLWNKQIVSGDQLLDNGREMHPYNGNSRPGFNNDMLGEHAIVDEMDMNPLEFLASQFPGFASESLAEVYFANGCDLNLTIEMLTQLELQVDSGFHQNMNVKTVSAPNLTALDFPALPVPDSQNAPSKYADELQQSGNPYRSADKENILLFKSSSSIPSRAGTVDFASAVRKMASQDSGMWKYDRNGSGDSTIGSSRSSHVLASSYGTGNGRGVYADRAHSRNSPRAAPAWLETGEAVANMYSELREEARDHARLRNAYFEQARQAYLIGNKALAKELSVKGQLHNMHMKAAHGKAQDSIYRLRIRRICCYIHQTKIAAAESPR
ncbi:polyadenylate-binding protein-interacting protein 7 isoform X2 [Euphorbia lathyris]|uniref:polyadenylate-binding protein-interacting protein 7 isoform X2 n=1 Tax=Euphorbia lathyris TaxID=212925 RepID=UPI003313A7DE